MHVSLANLDLDLPRNVVTNLCRSTADHSLRSITIVLSRLVLLAIELHGICASLIVDDLFFHVAVRGLHVRTLVVVFGGHINLVGGVAHPVLPSEAPLHLVCLLKGLVVNSFHQIAHQLIHIKTNPFNICFDHPSAIVDELGCAEFLILVAGPLVRHFLSWTVISSIMSYDAEKSNVSDHFLLHLISIFPVFP